MFRRKKPAKRAGKLGLASCRCCVPGRDKLIYDLSVEILRLGQNPAMCSCSCSEGKSRCSDL